MNATFRTVTKDLSKTNASVLVVYAAADSGKQPEAKIRLELAGCLGAADTGALVKTIQAAVKDGRFKGNVKETLFLRGALAQVPGSSLQHVLCVGLGQSGKVSFESVRAAGAVTAKALNSEKAGSAVICLATLLRFQKDAQKAAAAFAEGALLGAYRYDQMKSKKDEKKPLDLVVLCPDRNTTARVEKGIPEGSALAEATCFARDLGNHPANVLTPARFAEFAKDAAKGLPIKVTVWGLEQIRKAKMGCFLAVNQGAREEARFIIMEYSGGKKGDKPFVMVGKGLTFDSGGISIKPGAGMDEMKFDMCGGAAVVGAILALAKLKAKVNVVALVPSTENMPGGNSFRPGDILTASNGKTVEIGNTDAEGRLILSDALVYASQLGPKAIVDAATLTGACQVALGNVFTGYFTRSDKLSRQIEQASEAAGEKFWRMPLTDEYGEDMKGTYADLSNIGNAKGGGASQGAAFLEQFVDKEIPFAHFDIAATAWNAASRTPLNPDKGATGVAVRTLVRLATSL